MSRASDLVSRLVPSTRCGNLSVEVEGRSRLLFPRLARVMVEIAELEPTGGPGFLILSGGTRDYMQIAGGRGAYVVECRQYDGPSFRHFAAGRPGPIADRWVRVATNGFHVTVRPNEKLDCDDAQYLAYAFIKGSCRSRFFAWRDMTEMFG